MQVTLQPRRGFWAAVSLVAFLLGVATGVILTLRPQLVPGAVTGGVIVVGSCVLGAWVVARVRARQLAGYQDPGSGHGGGLAGVREPRPPHLPEDEGAVALPLPGAYGGDDKDLAS